MMVLYLKISVLAYYQNTEAIITILAVYIIWPVKLSIIHPGVYYKYHLLKLFNSYYVVLKGYISLTQIQRGFLFE